MHGGIRPDRRAWLGCDGRAGEHRDGLFARSGDRGARHSAFAQRLHAAQYGEHEHSHMAWVHRAVDVTFALGGRDGLRQFGLVSIDEAFDAAGDRLIGGPPVRRRS